MYSYSFVFKLVLVYPPVWGKKKKKWGVGLFCVFVYIPLAWTRKCHLYYPFDHQVFFFYCRMYFLPCSTITGVDIYLRQNTYDVLIVRAIEVTYLVCYITNSFQRWVSTKTLDLTAVVGHFCECTAKHMSPVSHRVATGHRPAACHLHAT